MATTYANLRKTVKMTRAAKCNGYKAGGTVAKKSSTTVNIVVPQARGDAPKSAPIAPVGPAPSPSRTQAQPVPPEALKASLGTIGAGPVPMMAKGGKVPSGKRLAAPKAMTMKAAKLPDDGAGGGLARLQKIKDYGGK